MERTSLVRAAADQQLHTLCAIAVATRAIMHKTALKLDLQGATIARKMVIWRELASRRRKKRDLVEAAVGRIVKHPSSMVISIVQWLS